MNTRFSLTAATALALAFSSLSAVHAAPSQDEQFRNWYLGGSGDLTWLRHSTTGGGANANFGYRMGSMNQGDIRIEAEIGYHRASGDSGYSATRYLSYMGNVYYDFNNVLAMHNGDWSISPYVGGGIGDAQVHYGRGGVTSTFHHHSSDFAWQGMTGLNLVSASMPNTTWSVGYRYLGTESPSIHSNSAEVGLKFNF